MLLDRQARTCCWLMFYTLQHTQTKPEVMLLLSRIGRTDPNISNIYTTVSIGIRSILAWYWHWYFCFSSFLMFSRISAHICVNTASFTSCTAHFAQPSPPLLCPGVLPSSDSAAAVREAQVLLKTDAITAPGRQKRFYRSYFALCYLSIGFSIGINHAGLLCSWYWMDTKFRSIAHHCC